MQKKCPRRESNSDLRFRKPPFYPLNYGDAKRSEAGRVSGPHSLEHGIMQAAQLA